jgi:hypothetical protein
MMPARRPTILTAANVCVLGTLAFLVDCSGCGGAIISGGDAGVPDAAGDASSSDARPDSSLDCLYPDAASAIEAGDAGGPCPPTPPTAGSACDVPDLFCEYGSNWWSRCNLLLSCEKGMWQTFEGGPDFCPQVAGGPSGGVCPANTCPATWADAVAIDGGPCPSFSCEYPEGDCLCGINSGAGCFGAAPSVWACLPATPGCTYPRPRFGTPCIPAPDASTVCQMGWGCDCQQNLYCNGEGVWVGNPLGQGCMQ